MNAIHLICVPKGKEYQRAIMALLNLQRTEYLALPDGQLVVSDDQIRALEQARISFKYLSQTGPNGAKVPPLQS